MNTKMKPISDGIWEYKHAGSYWKTYFDFSMVFGYQSISDVDANARKSLTQVVEYVSLTPIHPYICVPQYSVLFNLSLSLTLSLSHSLYLWDNNIHGKREYYYILTIYGSRINLLIIDEDYNVEQLS